MPGISFLPKLNPELPLVIYMISIRGDLGYFGNASGVHHPLLINNFEVKKRMLKPGSLSFKLNWPFIPCISNCLYFIGQSEREVCSDPGGYVVRE